MLQGFPAFLRPLCSQIFKHKRRLRPRKVAAIGRPTLYQVYCITFSAKSQYKAQKLLTANRTSPNIFFICLPYFLPEVRSGLTAAFAGFRYRYAFGQFLFFKKLLQSGEICVIMLVHCEILCVFTPNRSFWRLLWEQLNGSSAFP